MRESSQRVYALVMTAIFHRFVHTLVLLCAALHCPVHAAEDDAYLLSAREAVQEGDAERLARAAESLKGHVLWPYVALWQMQIGPVARTTDDWQRFIASQPESLTTQRARGELIQLLASQRDWAGVEREFAAFDLDDVDVRCQAMRARLNLNDPQALPLARQMWLQTATQGPGCTALFEQMVRARQLSDADVWARIRLHFESGGHSAGRALFAFLPASAQPSGKQWDNLNGNTTRYLQNKKIALKSRADRELAVLALYRTALSLPDLAHERWQQIKSQFPAPERAYGWAQLATGASFKHHPKAQQWFAQAGELPLSERQTAWKVRSAIRAGNWAVIDATIAGMLPADQEIATWRYWRARALRQAGKTTEANLLLAPLANETSFYGQLAAEDLGTSLSQTPTPIAVLDAEVETIAQHPGLRRALKLYELDMRTEAVQEWRWNIRRLDDRQLLAAAHLARRAGWWDRTIDTAERTRQSHDMLLRYPLPFREVFNAHSTRNGVDEAWVYGLVRQESRFITKVRSSAGAMGLMQLMPATASQVARRAGMGRLDRTDITTVETNVTLGTLHLRELMDLVENKPLMASAAYNAGLSRVRAWQPAERMEGVVFAESIPFSETRDYVKKVLGNTMHYARILGQPFVSLKERLNSVPGRVPATP
ncbi:MAG: lytic transglycosylase domain-containing protein [Betaproteobacteria bacterium]|nr:lytic transglycosylase domain-containing protein [Betaproteobacteria bacterium]